MLRQFAHLRVVLFSAIAQIADEGLKNRARPGKDGERRRVLCAGDSAAQAVAFVHGMSHAGAGRRRYQQAGKQHTVNG